MPGASSNMPAIVQRVNYYETCCILDPEPDRGQHPPAAGHGPPGEDLHRRDHRLLPDLGHAARTDHRGHPGGSSDGGGERDPGRTCGESAFARVRRRTEGRPLTRPASPAVSDRRCGRPPTYTLCRWCPARATAAEMCDRCVRPWGKLPSNSRVSVSYSSE